MPPPSPVWALDYRKEKAQAVRFFDATLQMHARIEGKAYESRAVLLRVKGAEEKKVEKVPGSP